MRTIRELTISAVSGVTLLLALVVSVRAEGLGAKILSTRGMVEVQSAVAVGQWVAMGAQTVVPPGAALRTGPDSQAVLELDGSVITLYETSLIRIPIAASTVSTSNHPMRHPVLDKGRALFDVTPTPEHIPFSVQTPTIVAGVKGTVFEVVATNTDQAVYVWRGLVEVASRFNTEDIQRVAAGQFTELDHLRLTLPSDIPFEREAPSGLEKHPDAGSDRARQVTALVPPISGVLPSSARPDTLPVDEHSAVSSWPDASHVDALPANVDHAATLWDGADQAAVQNALDRALDIQAVVSGGSLRVPADGSSVPTNTGNHVVVTTPDGGPAVSSVVSPTTDTTMGLLGVLGF